jgi:translation initiation factor eIF-2B subunit alpha/methylthioribose-1-phosphate isomerase
MRVRVGNKYKDYKSVWFENNIIKLIDQTKLPFKFEIVSIKNYSQLYSAIKKMVVRGAPAIGIAAAYGIAQAKNQNKNLKKVADYLKSARPTAHDLFYGIEYVISKIEEGFSGTDAAEEYALKIIAECKRIGMHGEKLIKNKYRILTHCNAGALATVDYGTALSPIRFAHYNGKKIFVYVDETRPQLQGARLTSWELYQEGIEHAVIADNAAGYFMQNKQIDIVIVGADRIAKNGDFANKIGTFEKAVIAYQYKIPFYVAAPTSTFDTKIKSGAEIVIEERNGTEISMISGKRIIPQNIKVCNPAFDITPAKYVTGYITEKGVIGWKELMR